MEFSAANREPKSLEALHKWIKALLGFHIPRVAPTEGQTSPFKFVSDAFFGEFERALVLASRGAGKTRDVSILNLLASKFRPGTQTVHFGAIGAQAGWGHEYLRDMLRPSWMSGDVIDSLRGVVRWHNGSWVRTATGHTTTGVTAIRGNRVVQDEIDLWDMQLFETSQMMIQGTETNPPQRIYISTQYTAYGLMGQLLREAASRDYKVFKWDVWSSISRCEKCLEQDCPLFIWENPRSGELEPLCKGRGLRSDGYVPRAAVIDEFLSTDLATWQVQKLLEEPSREYLLFNFYEDRSTGEPPREAFADSAQKGCGVDWGYDHPLVFTVFSEVGDDLWGIHEHGERFATPDREVEIATELAQQFGSERYPLIFYCGQDRPEAIAQLMEHNFIAVPCPVRQREARHRAIRRLLRTDPQTKKSRLQFGKVQMPSTIWQLSTVHRNEKTGKEVLEVNDFMDSASYILSAIDFNGAIAAGGGFMATFAVLTLLLFSIMLLI